MAFNMLSRSFTATSLSAFWRYWNPGYGFFLLQYCYKPLRKVFPHSVSLLLTFIVCGFCLHDVLYLIPLWLRDNSMPLPFVTCWFSIVAVCIVAADYFRVNFRGVHALLRVPIHVAFLAGTFSVARLML